MRKCLMTCSSLPQVEKPSPSVSILKEKDTDKNLIDLFAFLVQEESKHTNIPLRNSTMTKY